ncbi:MAG: branched-chain amino acid aminotransferase [Alphaproteobacteria bacterium]|nr:branched-chain amino acid aminotransferase [Alphaproteobacteria bacterium]
MGPWTWVDGAWHEGNPLVMGPMTHAAWLSSVVFDGARAFEGVAPDLDLHCARVVESALRMGMLSPLPAPRIEAIAREGIARFPADAELYIRPMIFAEGGWIAPDPASCRLTVSVYVAPLPPVDGFSACFSSYRRPAPDQAPTDAKASCLYPMAGRAMREAQAKGFDNAIMDDPWGDVAEFATANLFLVKDGVVSTPAVNGTFLNGITRQRVIGLLRRDGKLVIERSVERADLLAADEIFSCGNYGKVVPVSRLEARKLAPGPLAKRARALYWDWARGVG